MVVSRPSVIEKIQTRNITKPDYALLSLGLFQKSKNDID